MLNKIKIPHLFLAIGLIISLSVATFADTIRLKDGSIIKGRIVSFGDGQFTITIGQGSRTRQISFDAEDIESIQFDSNRMPETTAVRMQTNSRVEREPVLIDDDTPPASVSRRVPAAVNKPRVTNPPDAVKPRVTAPPIASTPKVTAPPVAAPKTNAKPIELGVKVLADNTANGWTNSGFVVKKGQKIRISGNGTISIGGGKTSTASGLYDLEDTGKLLKSVPTAALIAVIGDDNNEFIYIGSSREFTASRDGALFLGVNEGNLNDNSGAFDVKIEIEPA